MKKLMSVLFVGIFALCTFFSVGQLSANANVPACSGLSCNQPSDCGSKCFCNGPSSTCFLD